MRTRLGPLFATTLAVALLGCGGTDEVKKNEGTIVNTPPVTAGAPAGGSAADSGPAPNTAKAPAIPPIND